MPRDTGRAAGATAVFIDVAARTEPTKSARLQEAIREAIRAGRLESSDRLPSTRAMAGELGWARNVVVDAFDQLIAEGYLVARVGDGTRVAARPADDQLGVGVRAEPTAPPGPVVEVDLEPGLPDLGGFPMRAWRRSWSDALDRLTADDLGYRHPAGAPALRRAVARYLARTRAADLDHSQVLITNGVSAGLRLMASALSTPARPAVFGVEDPGAYTQRDAVLAAGAHVTPLPVDADGLITEHLDRDANDVDVILVTPAHQYPVGGVLSAERRSELIAWARARPGRLIIEDDYDAEFRYDRRPIGAIQGLAPDVTGLTSSVSKTLAPALRLGWIGVPAALTARLAEQMAHELGAPDVVQQHAMADLIESGRYDRIIRSRRHTYRRRRELMISALAALPSCGVPGAAGGLHLTIELPAGIDDVAVSAALRERGVSVPPLSDYRMRPGPPGLVASFATATPDAVRRFVRELHAVLGTGQLRA